jgi:branched-chain amino acid transport system permease protein
MPALGDAVSCIAGIANISLQQIIGYLFYMGILSLMGLGLTLMYQTTKVPNFAYGFYVSLGMYVAFLGHQKILGIMPPYPLAPLAFLLGGIASLATYLFVIKPLVSRGASLVQLMIATIAVDLFGSTIIYIISDYYYYVGKIYTAKGFLFRSEDIVLIQSLQITAAPVIVIALLVLLLIMLYVFINKTKLGIAMRASIENPGLAEILGIPTNRIYILSWFLAGALGGLAGLFYPMWLYVDPSVPARILITIFAVSIAGGLSSIYGPFLGALLVAYAESILPSQIYGCLYSVGYQDAGEILKYGFVFPMILIVIFIAFAPTGLAPMVSRAIEKISSKARR